MWSDKQYGFRRGLSVEDAWMYVQNAIRVNVNKYVLLIVHNSVMVDISMDKTMTMLLKGKLSPVRPPIVRLNGVSITYVTQVKF